MDFSNHRKGGMVFQQVFLLSTLQCTVTLLVEIHKRLYVFEEIRKRLREFEEAVEETVNAKVNSSSSLTAACFFNPL
jgi:hypothetical protein